MTDEQQQPEEEEAWKDDDFLSLGNSNTNNEETRTDEQPSTNAKNDLPPWMDDYTNFRRVSPLVALHNEIVGFCNLMSPMPKVRRGQYK